MIEAWLAAAVFAALASTLTGDAWLAALLSVLLLAVSYTLPWAVQTAGAAPSLFGQREEVDVGAIFGNSLATLGAGFLIALPAAATGELLNRTVQTLLPNRSATSEVRGRPLWRWVGMALALASLMALPTAAGLLRYGPSQGVYSPRPLHAVKAGRIELSAPRVQFGSFYSRALAAERPFAVYLPPGYASSPGKRYPVVYLLHGDPGSYRDWPNEGLGPIYSIGVDRDLLPPAVIVMPDGNGPGPTFSEWANSWSGRVRVEDSVLELVGYVDQHFRTFPDASHRVIAGLSSGGFGAANLATQHPNVFGICVSMSGYFIARGAVFGGNPSYLRANSPLYTVRASVAARSVYYVLLVGRGDPYYRPQTDAFAAELAALGVRHQVILLPGAHQWTVWTNGLVLAMEDISRTLPQFPVLEVRR